MARGIRQVAPNLALAASAARRRTWASRSTSAAPRPPILALGEALGDLREGRVDGPRRVRDIRSARVRRVRHHPGARTVTTSTAARLFDIGRDGFVHAALLVLEEATAAARRGAAPYAEPALGYGDVSDAYHMVQPRADGREAARAASIALTTRVEPGVVLRPTPTRRRPHSATWPRRGPSRRRCDRAATVPVSDEGPLRASARAVRGQAASARSRHPRRGSGVCEPRRPDKALGLLPGLLREPRSGRYERVLSTSFGFRCNAALVFGRVTEARNSAVQSTSPRPLESVEPDGERQDAAHGNHRDVLAMPAGRDAAHQAADRRRAAKESSYRSS